MLDELRINWSTEKHVLAKKIEIFLSIWYRWKSSSTIVALLFHIPY